jgi:hypothetical protein
MTREELVMMKDSLEDNMTKGLIRQSSFPNATPYPLAKKHDRGLRFSIDYTNIISEMIKIRYPLRLIQETFKLLAGARVYTKLDVRGAYHLVWVKDGDEHKLAFRTRYGLSEHMVMHFGTSNAPADFKGYFNNTIRESLVVFSSADLDDILIYKNSVEEHEQHVKLVMERL